MQVFQLKSENHTDTQLNKMIKNLEKSEGKCASYSMICTIACTLTCVCMVERFVDLYLCKYSNKETQANYDSAMSSTELTNTGFWPNAYSGECQ